MKGVRQRFPVSDDLRFFQDLLGRWSDYVQTAGLRALGISQSRYTEYVGKGAYSDPADQIDIDILSWDEFFTGPLPAYLRHVIRLHYLDPGPVKSKHPKSADQAYYARKTACEEVSLSLWREWRQRKEDAREEKTAVTHSG